MDIQLEKKKGLQKKHIPYVAGGAFFLVLCACPTRRTGRPVGQRGGWRRYRHGCSPGRTDWAPPRHGTTRALQGRHWSEHGHRNRHTRASYGPGAGSRAPLQARAPPRARRNGAGAGSRAPAPACFCASPCSSPPWAGLWPRRYCTFWGLSLPLQLWPWTIFVYCF